jgi:hypothetical protein
LPELTPPTTPFRGRRVVPFDERTVVADIDPTDSSALTGTDPGHALRLS